ncbi:MAG: restriction endonuclease [Burkholderiales bacterium RIFCSPLOWO2_02_FULL_57_36]|nr:MAG: restriction endonuclease [Burkholderiales bacterium RIFCSPLOWO2_02_FULL_57_36]
MWMVRAEVGGRYFEEFKTLSIVAIGWADVGDMSMLKTRDDFTQAINRVYKDMKKAQVAMSSSQTYRFVREIQNGDRVITYDPSERVYLVGTIVSEYEYVPDLIQDDPNIRRVRWEGEVSRDVLSVSARNSLGAISTLFLIPPDVAKEIESLVTTPGKTNAADEQKNEEEQQQVDLLLKDVQAKGFEFIKDKVNRLDWDELQELVAGLLRAMGYKTRISPSGSDRGKDIVASPDGLGFENPRIVAEVKHRSAAMGSQEIRSFLGGRHKDDKGLYVSTGGFTKDARYEAERASIPLTLMDIDDLVKSLLEHYEKMDADAQRLVPLRKIYWPG